MTIFYSRGANKFDNAPSQLSARNFDDFVDQISNDLSAAKGQTYICAPLCEGPHYENPDDYPGINTWRLANYSKKRRFLALDFDGFENSNAFTETCSYLGSFNCLIYTTASHTDELPRARAIVDLNREIDPKDGIRFGLALEKMIESNVGTGKIKFDNSVYRANQPIYTPIVGSQIFIFKGLSFNVDEVINEFGDKTSQSSKIEKNTLPLSVGMKTPNESKVNRMVSALQAIPANIDRSTWRDVLLSVKSHGFSIGETKAREWSETAGPYDPVKNRLGYDQKVFDDIWKYSPHSIGPGTLYHIAGKYGWLGTQGELFDSPLDELNIDVYGDIFNGRFFKDLFEGQMLYCYPRSKWLKFTGKRWIWCEGGEEIAAAKETALQIAKYAAKVFSSEPSNPNSKKLIQHAQNSQNINRLQAMLQTAAAEPGMGINSMNLLDSNTMLLGCKTGVVCLNSGTLLEPEPKMLITRQVDANYDYDSSCPIWIRFLDQCFLGDKEMIDYVQKALGYSLTGMVNEELLHFCFGNGRNGKSVFANVITKIMGDYAITAPAEMLMRRDRNGATNDIARLCGSRLVLANETRSDQRFDDLTIKTLVSTERISARFLHNEYFEFWPTFKIWIRGNHKPIIIDDSNGSWRRIRLVPFENSIPEDEIDPDLESKLLAERDGIFSWMVKGAIKWKAEGLKPSQRIKAASNQYRDDCDVIGDFLEENCLQGTGLKVSQKRLWGIWQEWSKENGYFCGSKKTFTRRLKDRGINADCYVNGARAYSGVGLSKMPDTTTSPQDLGGIQYSSHNQMT